VPIAGEEESLEQLASTRFKAIATAPILDPTQEAYMSI